MTRKLGRQKLGRTKNTIEFRDDTTLTCLKCQLLFISKKHRQNVENILCKEYFLKRTH
jgi:hypothetical protein